jgi:hypothetical protein
MNVASPDHTWRGWQSGCIFDSVCHQLDRPPGSIPLDQHRELFLASVAHGARRRIVEIETAASIRDVYREIWRKMSAYLARYQATAAFERKQRHVVQLFQRLTTRVDRLIAERDVDARTARVFLLALPSLRRLGDYDAVVRNHDGIALEDLVAANHVYGRVVDRMWEQHEQHARRAFEGFYHFNARPHAVGGRIYISAQLSAAPDRLVQAWHAALDATRTLGTVYFKVPVRLSRRFETIVVYQTRETRGEDLDALTAFVRCCPADLLNERSMPTAVPVYRGIAIAPEPTEVNKVIRYMGGDVKVSYNQFIASASELAFELAYQDALAHAAVRPTFQSLKSSAGNYFDQMMQLANLDPVTWIPDFDVLNRSRISPWPADLRS